MTVNIKFRSNQIDEVGETLKMIASIEWELKKNHPDILVNVEVEMD